jgi:hypothetical protein
VNAEEIEGVDLGCDNFDGLSQLSGLSAALTVGITCAPRIRGECKWWSDVINNLAPGEDSTM